MANALYDNARNLYLNAGLNWGTDTMKVVLLDSTYTVNLATHTMLSNLTGTVATSSALTGQTSTSGIAEASNVTFSTVASGSTVQYMAIYKDTGTASTSPLIAFIDTATGLPVLTNGGNITIAWDTGANKIFKL
jgi:hypothetical protein